MGFLKSLFGKKTKKEDGPISQKQIELVQNSFALVAPIAEQAAGIFYNKLFELDPSLKPLFTSDISEQGKKLMSMLAAAVNGLNNLTTLVPVVQDLGKRHVSYHVEEKHYDTVGEALLFTLKAGLGDEWTEDVEEAWTTVYVVLATTMKEAAATVEVVE
ncbi:globin family protein [Flammeovirga kamogawensis]|uniref:Hemin receptor n=1 Tax=Flammeovirga kamogawensis TaxID=373891 RepID=A0ABX8H356_9BACT|nr:globin family protein [Flammeovirga kamogawensis]MBB6463109.1 hemoglobin-like flavoprotein [Flammeovirga kamogawensis]QWG10345.1 hemin receptor [Flammeovirga kamogawensis]TRX63854.1 hemin receptor [Flammeovirga kamogawensis]